MQSIVSYKARFAKNRNGNRALGTVRRRERFTVAQKAEKDPCGRTKIQYLEKFLRYGYKMLLI